MEFEDAGTRDGTALVQHRCPGFRPGESVPVTYVSALPSEPGDEYLVPGSEGSADEESGPSRRRSEDPPGRAVSLAEARAAWQASFGPNTPA